LKTPWFTTREKERLRRAESTATKASAEEFKQINKAEFLGNLEDSWQTARRLSDEEVICKKA
jgi:hypothetical protein